MDPNATNTSTNTNANPNALRFEDVTRVYGSGPNAVRALGPIAFDVRAGELVAIMGPSGSGKTTLLALAGALDRATTGRVLVNGEDLASRSANEIARLRRRVLGYVFQELNLLPGLTAVENVALPRELDGSSLDAARAEALAALDGVGLRDLAARFPDDLSGGEQQRVAIARAFVGPRSILLADEPTGALDSVTGERVMRLLREHCDRGRTVVLVTHDASHAAWADRVLFLRDGRIVDETRAADAVRPSIVPSQT
jgi:putative ABC transport system ATP-binding protein